MILKIVFLKKNYNNCIISVLLALAFFVLFSFLTETMVNAEIRLPKLETPTVQLPDVPTVPSPQMPEIKTIDIDTTQIADEIDAHAKAAKAKDEKNAQDNTASPKSKENAPADDKIKNNKYIKRGDADTKGDDSAGGNNAENTETATDAADTPAKTDQESGQAANAQQLLTSGFFAIMFYIFSRTAFIAIVLWLLILYLVKKGSIMFETFSFFLMNIIAGAFYFPLAGKLEGGKIAFYDKVISNDDFLVIMTVFSLCVLVTAGLLGILAVFLQNINKGGYFNGKNTKKFI
ncbi:hypothetical protein [Pectinatus cerevisiiphilus]|uniref:Uncharacterized protein n=1 Tax=Pectinatus cerevisiiphilus TaxID=86956 RepID=A0A4R3K372_9FIRM|nr:hypothetical protein [Pectinatus cerevisiiphilus]TCS77138.1 hypothetical protein EDC37_1186 [Pectinatus cerevisiiphilus]